MLALILTAWALLFVVIFFSSHDMLVMGLARLEQKLAVASSNRVYQSMLRNLDSVHILNKRLSENSSVYMYLYTPDRSFHESNFITPELFIDDGVDFLFIYDNLNKLALKRQYNLEQDKFMPVPKEIVTKMNSLMKNYKSLITLYPDSDGKAFFFKTKNSIPLFVTMHGVRNSLMDTTYGTLIFIKRLTPDFYKNLSKQLQHPILQLPLSEETNVALKAIKTGKHNGKRYFIDEVNEATLAIYRYIYNYKNEPIALFRVEQSRYLHQQNRRSMMYHLVVILMYSLFGMLSMILIVVLFFRKQEQYTDAFARFVPKAFLDLLDKPSILDVELGNHTQKEISVLFMDIRSFTTLSESMTPKENFDFINNFLMHLAPVISYHGGFVDKFIGDAIMALFHRKDNAEDGIDAGLGLFNVLKEFNDKREQNGLFPIQIGVGINTGDLMLGVIGEGQRFEGTVISDVVNTTSRIESMSKVYGSKLLISENTLKKITNPEKYNTRFIDKALMKGKSQEVGIYEVFNMEDDKTIALKYKTADKYKEAWALHHQKDYQAALKLFDEILAINPNDGAAALFQRNCIEKIHLKDR